MLERLRIKFKKKEGVENYGIRIENIINFVFNMSEVLA